MKLTNLRSRGTAFSYSFVSRDVKIALAVVTFTAIGSATFFTYSLGYTNGYEDFMSTFAKTCSSLASISDNDFPYWLNIVHLYIALEFFISAIGLWSRRVFGFFLSLLALLGVFLVYVWWYLETLNYLTNTELIKYTKFSIAYNQNIGLFREATRWDIIVLVAAVVLFLWQILRAMTINKKCD